MSWTLREYVLCVSSTQQQIMESGWLSPEARGSDRMGPHYETVSSLLGAIYLLTSATGFFPPLHPSSLHLPNAACLLSIQYLQFSWFCPVVLSSKLFFHLWNRGREWSGTLYRSANQARRQKWRSNNNTPLATSRTQLYMVWFSEPPKYTFSTFWLILKFHSLLFD